MSIDLNTMVAEVLKGLENDPNKSEEEKKNIGALMMAASAAIQDPSGHTKVDDYGIHSGEKTYLKHTPEETAKIRADRAECKRKRQEQSSSAESHRDLVDKAFTGLLEPGYHVKNSDGTYTNHGTGLFITGPDGKPKKITDINDLFQ